LHLRYFVAHKHTLGLFRSQYLFFNWYQSLVHSVLDLFLECNLLTSILFIFTISQNLNSVLPFDETNYGYWKACMRFFLKSIDVWKIIETGWIKPEEIDEITITQTSTRLSNDKALHALCQALSPSEFARISSCEVAKDA